MFKENYYKSADNVQNANTWSNFAVLVTSWMVRLMKKILNHEILVEAPDDFENDDMKNDTVQEVRQAGSGLAEGLWC